MSPVAHASRWHTDTQHLHACGLWRDVPARRLRADAPQASVECRVWSVAHGDWDDRGCAALLDARERERMRRLPLERQAAYARHHASLRVLLAEWLGVASRSLVIAPDAHGKPALPDHPRLHFNLSHSGPFGGVALGECPVGFDLEAPDGAAYDRLAWRLYAFEAAALAKRGGTPRDPRAFARLWTAKESYLKATGEGLRRRLDSFRLRVGADARAFALLDDGAAPPVRACHFLVLDEPPALAYVGTLAVLSAAPQDDRFTYGDARSGDRASPLTIGE
ncbi:4'-phosphopantetheinyl transferase family protein [Burkholderia sp. LMG 32019]|uniref:4'-phosphopantetheinyl transferase family protein n=1 Tax=Burkholderia sp. LMG 32019 TaxID=3158173 RepID=UPI003C2E9FEF